MFSLIITIISIALVAALALATLYYGGKAFNKGSEAAVASTVLNTGQQVSGAFQLFASDAQASNSATSTPTLPSLLSGSYLKSVPTVQSVAWREVAAAKGWLLLPSAISKEACIEFNKKVHNLDGIPQLPINGVSKLCYGTASNGFSVVWRAYGEVPLALASADAATAGTDGAGVVYDNAKHSPVNVSDSTWEVVPNNNAAGEFLGLADAGGPPPPPPPPPVVSGFVYPTLGAAEQVLYAAMATGVSGGFTFESQLATDLQNDANNDGYGIHIKAANMPIGWEVDVDAMSGSGHSATMPTNCPTSTSAASECTGSGQSSLYPPVWHAASQTWRMRAYHVRADSSSSYNAPGYVNVTLIKTSTKGTGSEERETVYVLAHVIDPIN